MRRLNTFFNVSTSCLIVLLLLMACNQTPKQTSSKQSVKITTKPIVNSPAIKADSPLICVSYSDAEVGKFNIEEESFDDFINGNENYFKGKTKLSDNYVKKHLFNAVDSIPIENPNSGEIVEKNAVNDYIRSISFYLVSTVIKAPQYKGIIYEELTGDNSYYHSQKYFSTINNDGKFISRLIIASYGFAGTYTKDDGTKGGYYSGVGGCISKNLVIDMGGGDDGKYKILRDGRIVKYMPIYYDSLLAIRPNEAELHLKYAGYLRDKYDRDFIGAKKQFEAALKIDPKNSATNEDYGIVLMFLNDTTNAKRYLKKAVDLAPNYEPYRSQYQVFLNRHSNDKEIIKGYEKQFRGIDSNDFVKQLDYAHFLRAINRKEEGRKHYLKAIQLNSNLKNKADDSSFAVR